MFRKVLIPVDFSEYSKKLLENLDVLKDLGAEEIVLTHVVDVSLQEILKMTALEHGEEGVNKITSEAMKKAEKLLEEIASKFDGFNVKTIVRFGFPAEEIAKIAKEENVSLVYMGGRGWNWLSAKLIGDVAEEVAYKVDVPIIFVKFKIWEDDEGRKELKMPFESLFEKILFATDFSEKCSELKDIVKEMALRGGKRVVIVSIAEPIHYMLEKVEYEDIMKKAMKLKKEFEEAGIHVKMHVENGIASREIVRIADLEVPSLVAIGSIGVGGAKSLGRTADNVMRRVETAVFIYK